MVKCYVIVIANIQLQEKTCTYDLEKGQNNKKI